MWPAWGGGRGVKGALVLMQLRGKGHLKSGSFGGRDGLSHWEVGILAVRNEAIFCEVMHYPPPPHQQKKEKKARASQKKMNGPLIYNSVQG